MKIAVLFGAGASYGAGPVEPANPPLGAGLYEELRRAYPQTWGEQIHSDEHALLIADPPFEQGMAAIWAKREVRVQELLTDMAFYFTRFRPGGVTWYARLLQVLWNTGNLGTTVFCSLNYECIFERVVWASGLTIQTFKGPVGPAGAVAAIPLLKPHGSCNYVMPNVQNFRQIRMSSSGAYYQWPLDVVDPDQLESLYPDPPSMPPALSIYEPEKSSPVGSQVIQAVRDNWREVASDADLVICIGARPVTQDPHIWDPIIESKADVWFVGGRDPDFGRLTWSLGDRMSHLADYFDDAVPEIQQRLSTPPPKLWVPSSAS